MRFYRERSSGLDLALPVKIPIVAPHHDRLEISIGKHDVGRLAAEVQG